MLSARSAAAAVCFSVAVLLTIPHAAIGQHAPAAGMSSHFGAIGGRAGAFGFQRGFAPSRFDAGFRRRLGDGLGLPRFGPIGFGFPHRQFGFFFDGLFDGFAAFPFVDGFFFFDRFQFIDEFPFIPGFPNRRFGFSDFGPRGLPLGFFPSFGGWGWGGYAPLYVGAPYPADTLASGYVQQASDARPALGRQLAVPGTGSTAGDSLMVERVMVMDVVPEAVLRLTWRNAGLPAQQVALFLADTAQAVIAAQTIRAPPFTALLQPPPGTAFAGVTVAWRDGTTSTRLVPYRSVER
jgi:hypothetical protein